MTLEEFYTEVLRVLGVLAGEESPTAADRAVVAAKYESVHGELSRRNLMTWFDDEDLPAWAVDAMAHITAARLLSHFHVPQSISQGLRQDYQGAVSVIVSDGQRRQINDAEIEFY